MYKCSMHSVVKQQFFIHNGKRIHTFTVRKPLRFFLTRVWLAEQCVLQLDFKGLPSQV